MKQGRIRDKKDAFAIIAICVTIPVLLLIGTFIFMLVQGGIENFARALCSEEIRFSIKMSLTTSIISTALCMALALPIAYAYTRTDLPLKRSTGVLLELSMTLPYLVIGLGLLILFSSEWGKALKDIGFRVVFDWKGIVIAQLFVNLPFAIRMIRTAMEQVDERLEMIAGMLGASRWKQFCTITLPLCKNSLISTAVLTWFRGIGEFGGTLMLVGVTRMKTETLPGSIYLGVSTGDTGMAMASATLLMLIAGGALIITNLLNRPPAYFRIHGK